MWHKCKMLYKLGLVIDNIHEDAVRDICVTSDERLVSSSHDGVIKVSRIRENKINVEETFKCNGTSTLCCLKSGLICTGGIDSVISIFEVDQKNPNPKFLLNDHSGPICKLAAGRNANVDILISSSWDLSVRGWKFPHESAPICFFHLNNLTEVATAICYSSENIYIGFFNGQIKIFDLTGVCKTTFRGHNGCVRDISIIGQGPIISHIVSCGNDGEIKKWSLENNQGVQLEHHHSFMYSLFIKDDFIVSSGETGTFFIGNITSQVFEKYTIPCRSIWKIVMLENSDIILGCSDGSIRSFSNDPRRQAPSEITKPANINVIETIEKTICGRKISQFPNKTSLNTKGCPGDIKLVFQDNDLSCYQWTDSQWNELGTVVNDNGSTVEVGDNIYTAGNNCDAVLIIFDQKGKKYSRLPFINQTESSDDLSYDSEAQSSCGMKRSAGASDTHEPREKKLKLSLATVADLNKQQDAAFLDKIGTIQEVMDTLRPEDRARIEVLIKLLVGDNVRMKNKYEDLQAQNIRNKMEKDFQMRLTSMVYSQWILEEFKKTLLSSVKDVLPKTILSEAEKLKIGWEILFSKVSVVPLLVLAEKIIADCLLHYPEIQTEIKRIKRLVNPKATLQSWIVERSSELFLELSSLIHGMKKLNWLTDQDILYGFLITNNLKDPKPSDVALISILHEIINGIK